MIYNILRYIHITIDFNDLANDVDITNIMYALYIGMIKFRSPKVRRRADENK